MLTVPSSADLRATDLMFGVDLVCCFLRTLGLDFVVFEPRDTESWLAGSVRAMTDVDAPLFFEKIPHRLPLDDLEDTGDGTACSVENVLDDLFAEWSA